MRALAPGAWYLLFLCRGCQNKQILFRDLSEGKGSLLGATYTVVCQGCGHKAKPSKWIRLSSG
jgi:ribosomal protein S27E